MPQMIFFAIATLSPLALIGLAATFGGIWTLLAPLYMTALTASLDELVKHRSPTAGEEVTDTANSLSVVIALGQFVILVLVIRAFAGAFSGWEKAGLFIGTGLFLGQVGNSNAHELIHRGSRFLHDLGMWAYISVLFGHHTSAHVLVHHQYAATVDDPNSARKGEMFYRFAGRAWKGSFLKALQMESERLARAGRSVWRHPYVVYICGAVLMLLLATLIGGLVGLCWYLALAGFAQIQLLLSDYVQHYGLQRRIVDGKPEPISLRHSWNSEHWYSSALMLNAPRHSDHHAHATRPYPSLELGDIPMLPRSLPVMACVALYPRLWKRIMDPRAAEWQQTA